jgi:hypothetical protein
LRTVETVHELVEPSHPRVAPGTFWQNAIISMSYMYSEFLMLLKLIFKKPSLIKSDVCWFVTVTPSATERFAAMLPMVPEIGTRSAASAVQVGDAAAAVP